MADTNRFKDLVHYVCTLCAADPTKLGAVQLNKALWLSDLRSYYQLGHAITKARYVKQKFGPVPSSITPVLNELQRDGILTVRAADHFGKKKREFIVNRKASSDFLSSEENQIVKDVVSYVTEEHTATSISKESHDHIWKAAIDGEELPLYTVFAVPGTITDEEREWAQLMLENER
jgi:DNA-binding PadR family transcriptional regulator